MFGRTKDSEIEMDITEISFTPGTPLDEARASTEKLILNLSVRIEALEGEVTERQTLLTDYKRVRESYKLALTNMNEPKAVKGPKT